MTEVELELVKASLDLIEQELIKMRTVKNANIAHLSDILFEIIHFGNTLVANNVSVPATE